MRLYTVDRGDLLKTVEKIELSLSDPYDISNGGLAGLYMEQELYEHTLMLFPIGLSRHGWRYLKERHTYGDNNNGFTHNSVFFTEMNLEYVRRAHYSDKPSRMQSVFASETLVEAELFRRNYGHETHKIYEIDCERFLKVDMNYIYFGVHNISGSFIAHKYWQGKASPRPYWEYIVELPALIVKEVL